MMIVRNGKAEKMCEEIKANVLFDEEYNRVIILFGVKGKKKKIRCTACESKYREFIKTEIFVDAAVALIYKEVDEGYELEYADGDGYIFFIDWGRRAFHPAFIWRIMDDECKKEKIRIRMPPSVLNKIKKIKEINCDSMKRIINAFKFLLAPDVDWHPASDSARDVIEEAIERGLI